MRSLSLVAILLLIINPVFAQKPTKNSLDDLRFLIGEWEGVGGGGPGEGKGVFSFAFDLQNKAIVRKNYAEYPATASRPAVRHEDLIVIISTILQIRSLRITLIAKVNRLPIR